MLKPKNGFTIIESLIVVVIIGILAFITLISYSQISSRASDAALVFDLQNAQSKIKAYYSTYGSYPASLNASGCPVASGSLPADTNYCIPVSGSNTVYNYSSSGQTYSLILKSSRNVYYQGTESVAQTTFTPAPYMQTITTANCPSIMTRAQDARDSHTYWVQKLGDGKCWMLTNLAYGGGGTNTYGDVKTLTNASGNPNLINISTANYYVNPNVSTFTVEPSNPSTNSDGRGQWGYLYNFCAVMGVQLATASCANATTPVYNLSTSICPSGWRTPTDGEVQWPPYYANGNTWPTNFNIYLTALLSTKTDLFTGTSTWSTNPPDVPFSYTSTYNGNQVFSNTVIVWWANSNTQGAYTGGKDMAAPLRCIAN
jgi:prepilin-type N-terminal cleavage/methylation domain-containing protein/uncharacterized protein (TIGR02145 family)